MTRSTSDEELRPTSGKRYDDISRRSDGEEHGGCHRPGHGLRYGRHDRGSSGGDTNGVEQGVVDTDTYVTVGINAIARASATVTQIRRARTAEIRLSRAPALRAAQTTYDSRPPARTRTEVKARGDTGADALSDAAAQGGQRGDC